MDARWVCCMNYLYESLSFTFLSDAGEDAVLVSLARKGMDLSPPGAQAVWEMPRRGIVGSREMRA